LSLKATIISRLLDVSLQLIRLTPPASVLNTMSISLPRLLPSFVVLLAADADLAFRLRCIGISLGLVSWILVNTGISLGVTAFRLVVRCYSLVVTCLSLSLAHSILTRLSPGSVLLGSV